LIIAQGHDLIALIMMGQDEEFSAESRFYGADPFDRVTFLRGYWHGVSETLRHRSTPDHIFLIYNILI